MDEAAISNYFPRTAIARANENELVFGRIFDEMQIHQVRTDEHTDCVCSKAGVSL
jgi:hypothetical protein